MSILRLPPALRREVYRHSTVCAITTRSITTTSHNDSVDNSLLSSNAPPAAVSKSLLTLSPATLNSYDVSTPPSTPDLRHAGAFFTRHSPTLLFSAPYFRSFPPSPFPEVAFLGRSNVGKSSLLNALFGRPNEKPAHVSKRPGKTRTMNGYGIGGEGLIGAKAKTGEKIDAANASDPTWKRFGRGGVVVVDMPGYGSGSREEWGAEIMKYLTNRKQLRRTYVLIDTSHGLKSSDISLLTHLRSEGIPHQLVLSKVDKLLYPEPKAPSPQKLHNRLLKLQDLCAELKDQLNEAASGVGGRSAMHDLLCCSAEKSIDEKGKNRRIGIDELRWSVLTACGLEGKPLTQGRSQRERNGRRMEAPKEGRMDNEGAYVPMDS